MIDDAYDIDLELVRGLLSDQHPDLSDLGVGERFEGMDTVVFRLGEELAVRLPRWPRSIERVETELRWLPELSRTWTFPAQVPVRQGGPGRSYPATWAVVRWIDGVIAFEEPLRGEAAAPLGAAISQIHLPHPPDAPFNDEQSMPIAERDGVFRSCLAEARVKLAGFDEEMALQVWEGGLAAGSDVDTTWIHADLHPFNVISDRGRFAGIIDWSDMARGDPASDIGRLWLLLEADAVPTALQAYGEMTQGTMRRAEAIGLFMCLGWAVAESPRIVPLGIERLAGLGYLDSRNQSRQD
jgi:aminoglycoside phosphotransferase (APT) family kinase protein